MEIKKKRIVAAAGLTATFLSLGIIGTTALGTAFAKSNPGNASQFHKNKTGTGQYGMHGMMGKNIQRTVQNITNGIQVTLTSTDAAIVTQLQAEKRPAATADSKVTVTQTNITNGVQLTMTSTDAATVTKLQSDSKNGFGPGMGMGHRGGQEGMGMFDKNVQRAVQNITNGIQVTLTSTDAATVTKLQSMKQPTPPVDSKVTFTQTNITNGIQLNMTSTDAATVTKLQQREQNGGKHGHGPFGPSVKIPSQQ